MNMTLIRVQLVLLFKRKEKAISDSFWREKIRRFAKQKIEQKFSPKVEKLK